MQRVVSGKAKEAKILHILGLEHTPSGFRVQLAAEDPEYGPQQKLPGTDACAIIEGYQRPARIGLQQEFLKIEPFYECTTHFNE